MHYNRRSIDHLSRHAAELILSCYRYTDLTCGCLARRLSLADSVGTARHTAISTIQSKAVVELIRSATLTHVECCEVLGAAARVQWAQESDFEVISAVLASQVESPPAKRARRPQQNFESFLEYGTASFWVVFNGNTTAPTSRLAVLCQLLLTLGLRCPTEQTFKLITSAWLVATHARCDLWNIDTQTKLTFLRHVKTTFDSYRRKAAEPMVYIEVLPAETAQYLRDYRQMWDSVFGDSLPEKSQLDFSVVSAFDGSYGCRGGANASRHVHMAMPDARQQVGGSSGSRRGDDGMERYVTQMADMQMNQHRFLEFVLTNQQGTGLQALCGLNRRPSLALSSLQSKDDSDSQSPRPPLLAIDDDVLPLGPSVRRGWRSEQLADALMHLNLVVSRMP